jgi:hypothetical protein
MNGNYTLLEFVNGKLVTQTVFPASSLSVAKRKAQERLVRLHAYCEVWYGGKPVLVKTDSIYSKFKEI